MKTIDSLQELEALYGNPSSPSLNKVSPVLTPHYKTWISASKFLILTTVGAEGTDASPRGEAGPVVRIVDDRTVMMPDWRGNNRLDSLKNIVSDGRVSLMFMVTGSTTVVRINGTAVVTSDADVTNSFAKSGTAPKTVIVVSIREVYFQCAKALMRSEIWSDEDQSTKVPSAGDFIREFTDGFDATAYDEDYPTYAKERMW